MRMKLVDAVSRTTIRPFMFTSKDKPSVLEILVRCGNMLPLKKPARAEKGLCDVSLRDGKGRPVLLTPLLERPDLACFEPDPTSMYSSEVKNPAKTWVDGLNSLGDRTVALSKDLMSIREVKRVDWKDLRNLVLFRYHCGYSPNKNDNGSGEIVWEFSWGRDVGYGTTCYDNGDRGSRRGRK